METLHTACTTRGNNVNALFQVAQNEAPKAARPGARPLVGIHGGDVQVELGDEMQLWTVPWTIHGQSC